jgi:Resolvase, N terminal domain
LSWRDRGHARQARLQRLIADCRAGKIGTVIAKDPDRLSRDLSQLLALLHIFEMTGVRVIYSAREGQSDTFVQTVISADMAGLPADSTRGANDPLQTLGPVRFSPRLLSCRNIRRAS